jgi:16S rRNA (adenine1518-N6/adenine1519-N6)-dimethyltransferase
VLSGIRARKRLGQHFLKDRSFAIRIVQAMDLHKQDLVLEIGSGKGALTELLLKSPAQRVYGIEIDQRFCHFLKQRFLKEGRFHLIEGDILKFDVVSICQHEHALRVVGNLPYYITSPVLFHLFRMRSWIKDLVITVQKEVGDRIVSLPGSRTYGVPSVLFQTYCQVKTLFLIPRKAFHPIPEVDSLVIQINFNKKKDYQIIDEELYEKVVKCTFNQRRKMLRNTLRKLVKDGSILNDIQMDLSRRPETLSVPEFVVLSNQIIKQINRKSLGRDEISK